jgi:hypothetical protein
MSQEMKIQFQKEPLQQFKKRMISQDQMQELNLLLMFISNQ